MERTQRRNAELKLDLTGKLEELGMVEIELEKKTEGRKASMEQWKQETKERRKHRMQEM